MSQPTATAWAARGVGVLLLGLFAITSAWIIRGEGRNYRENLQAQRSDAEPDEGPEPDPSAGRQDLDVDLSTPAVPGSKVHKLSTPPPPPMAPPEPSRAESPAAQVAEVARAEPATSPVDPFWTYPEQTRAWDMDRITPEDEVQLGADLHRMVLHRYKAVEVGPLPKRMEDAAEPFLAARSRKDLKYTFTVLDTDESNAFSHPGGYVYVTRGVFDWITEEEDDALGFILGHEIAHVDMAHAIRCLRDPEVKKLKVGTVPLFYALVLPWGYAESQDLEADRWACQRMQKAGVSRHATMAFLRKLEDFARKHGFENVRRRPGDDPQVAPIDNHLRAHPIPRKRIKDLKAILDPSPTSR